MDFRKERKNGRKQKTFSRWNRGGEEENRPSGRGLYMHSGNPEIPDIDLSDKLIWQNGGL